MSGRSGPVRWPHLAPSLVIAVLLALFGAGTPAGPLASAPGAAEPGKRSGDAAAAGVHERAGEGPGQEEDEQSPEEADAALARLMAERRAVRAVTARGRTIADAPPFVATPRKDRIPGYPCTNCHDNEFVNRQVRQLEDEHADLVFDHGGGRFWCYDACHKGTDIDTLVSLRGRPIDYDESYKLCGQCHFERQKDWYFGGHGKRRGAWESQREIPATADQLVVRDRERIGVWTGERVILNCTECHDPHSPAIKPFEPSPPPGVRAGLTRPPSRREAAPKIWDRLGEKRKGK